MFYQTYTACKALNVKVKVKGQGHRCLQQTGTFCRFRERWERRDPFFVPRDLDLWPWHSNSSERGTKRVFPVNFAQIHSLVPGIFHAQTKNEKVTALEKEPYLSAVINVTTVYNSCFLPQSRYLASSSSFDRTAHAHVHTVRQSAFLPVTSPYVDWS